MKLRIDVTASACLTGLQEVVAITFPTLANSCAVEAAIDAPDFGSGLARARAIYAALVVSDAARAARNSFLASRTREAVQRRDQSIGEQKSQ